MAVCTTEVAFDPCMNCLGTAVTPDGRPCRYCTRETTLEERIKDLQQRMLRLERNVFPLD